MTEDEFVLALTLWREASNQGVSGMTAVACVIRNRMHKWGGSFYTQCIAHNQFSSMVIKGDPNTVRWPMPSDSAWLTAKAIVVGIISGATEDLTKGALYYDNPATATSPWFFKTIVEDTVNHPLTFSNGAHKFYA